MLIPSHKLVMTDTGVGVITNVPIKKGDIVWKHSPKTEFRIPLQIYHLLNKHAYIDGDDVVIDLDDSKFINHSCDPTIIDSRDDCIATRDIKKGEELTWDYKNTALDSFKCICGSKTCRGKIDRYVGVFRPWGMRRGVN